jgi:dolichol-phosphate mannosyltransferase
VGSCASVCLVVPTRHEQDNVAELVRRVEKALATIMVDWEVLFVDDSDDATPVVIRELARTRGDNRIRLIHRTPDQRGGSIAGAIILGLQNNTADVIVVLDADLQHPPEILPWMIAPLVLGRADVCVPGRYLPGGSALGLTRRWRRLASRGSGLVLQTVFGETRHVNDPGGGLFAIRRGVIDGVTLRPHGFKSLAEVLVRGRWETHCEFPYVFEPRDDGVSKAMLRDGVPFLRHVVRMWTDTRIHERCHSTPRRRVAPVDPILIAREPTQPDATLRAGMRTAEMPRASGVVGESS